jgi:hypothetical protein
MSVFDIGVSKRSGDAARFQFLLPGQTHDFINHVRRQDDAPREGGFAQVRYRRSRVHVHKWRRRQPFKRRQRSPAEPIPKTLPPRVQRTDQMEPAPEITGRLLK